MGIRHAFRYARSRPSPNLLGPAIRWVGFASRRVLFTALMVLHVGCASGRSPAEAVQAADERARAYLVACPPEVLNRWVPRAGAEMELEVERPSRRIGEPWVLHRSPRLLDPAIWWVVRVTPNPFGGSILEVLGISEYRPVSSTWETNAKDSELAFRVITLAHEELAR